MRKELLDEMERLRLKLLGAFEAERRRGSLSESEWTELRELLMRIEHVPVDEVKERMQRLVSRAVGAGRVQGGGLG